MPKRTDQSFLSPWRTYFPKYLSWTDANVVFFIRLDGVCTSGVTTKRKVQALITEANDKCGL